MVRFNNYSTSVNIVVDEPVTVSVDASSKGLGVVLLQNGQPVAYGSKALSETQKRYAQIEREMLAILYGCQTFDPVARDSNATAHHFSPICLVDPKHLTSWE
jgi:hypothetical protein